jgi:hypothetical protein
MAIPALVRDFKEFLKSLNSNGVEYLLIGTRSGEDLADLENLPD